MNAIPALAALTQGRDHFLRCADEIGRRLCRDALRAGDRVNWLRAEPEWRENLPQTLLRPVGADLYQGAAGIALFLAQLHHRTGDRLVARTADQALRLAEAGAGGDGFYTGAGGVGATMISIGLMRNDGGLVERGLDMVGQAARMATGTDLLGGAAGLVPALLALARHHARPDFHEQALRLGTGLLDIARKTDTPAGFAHGGSGLLPALTSLHLATGEPHWAEALALLLHRERTLFDPQAGNWPDYRDAAGQPSAKPAFGASWCHGAAGIGRSRLWLLAAGAQDPALEGELEAALRAAALSLNRPAAPEPPDFSYCHGLAGMADLILDAGLWRNRPDLVALAAGIGLQGIERHAAPRTPWPCAIRGVGEVPGLMTGLAGIGHFYLRLHDPLTSGSVLLPDPYLGTRNIPTGENTR
ncbi:lanthionine synthetase LanC family protein [Niveispirillum sp.]|uniref:lanthionine synthetase LanC family protein n=1 Tax=Niveispirillum sp. TaxID=1917217 RepID=UPI001B5667C6|nr:lanthionine synthetase LanC family protein [Niveispirillum sp.]MBP7340607.1 hypothetical protein [Niveispirillum sp.]